MRLKLMYLFTTLSALCAASPLMAQGTPTAKTIWSFGALGLGIAAGICGIGQGMATKGACEGLARNPGAAANIRFALILGLAFIESLVLYTLVMVVLGY